MADLKPGLEDDHSSDSDTAPTLIGTATAIAFSGMGASLQAREVTNAKVASITFIGATHDNGRANQDHLRSLNGATINPFQICEILTTCSTSAASVAQPEGDHAVVVDHGKESTENLTIRLCPHRGLS